MFSQLFALLALPAVGAVAGLYGAWGLAHLARRVLAGRSVLDDASCDRCRTRLGPWRQLPLLRFGVCPACGLSPPREYRQAELAGACLGVLAALLAGASSLPFPSLLAGLGAGVLLAPRR